MITMKKKLEELQGDHLVTTETLQGVSYVGMVLVLATQCSVV